MIMVHIINVTTAKVKPRQKEQPNNHIIFYLINKFTLNPILTLGLKIIKF